MKRVVLTFGVISGLISAVNIAIACAFMNSDSMSTKSSMIVGYTTMFFAFLLIFFGIRSYRDNVGGGTITFGRAVQIGILITLVSTLFYVVTWEIIYYNFTPDFADKLAAKTIAEMRADGASAAEIAEKEKEFAQFKIWYANPLLNAAITFLEPFPVGLILTLVSAAILRKKPETPQAATAMA